MLFRLKSLSRGYKQLKIPFRQFTVYNERGEEVKFDVESFRGAVHEVLHYYKTEKEPKPQLLKKVAYNLEGLKMGIFHTDMVFQKFIDDIIPVIQDMKPQEVLYVIERFLSLNIKYKQIWDVFEGYFKNNISRFTFNDAITYAYFLIKAKRYNNSFKFIEQNIVSFEKYYKTDKQNLSLRNMVELTYIFNEVGLSYDQLNNDFRSMLDNLSQNVDVSLNPNYLADCVFLLYMQGKEDDDLHWLAQRIAYSFITQDQINYDAQLQQYEYGDTKKYEIGIKDILRWDSLGIVTSVYASQRFFNSDLLQRSEETVIRKSETDLIDFESASIILSALLRVNICDTTTTMRILEMLEQQFSNEGHHQLIEFNGKNISLFLATLTNYYNLQWDDSLVNVIYEYIEGLLRSKDIHHKIERHEYEIILNSYKQAQFYKPQDPEFLKQLEAYMKEKKSLGSVEFINKFNNF